MSEHAQNAITTPESVGVGAEMLDDPHRSRSDARLINRAILNGWMKPEEFKELIEKGAKLAKKTEDAREYNAAMSPMLSAMKVAQAERLHDKAKKVEVDHNVSGSVLLMPQGYEPDQQMPEADTQVIDAYEVAKDGDEDEA